MSQLYQGVPREDIPWFPMIDPERCDHCLKCLEFCPHDVYESVEGKLEVANPFNCPVGCSRCQSVCPQKAIAFMSPRDLGMMLQQLRRQRAGLM
jgi:NAD-dependent dihydropyrimidine dehydrogenase PreA subunit